MHQIRQMIQLIHNKQTIEKQLATLTTNREINISEVSLISLTNVPSRSAIPPFVVHRVILHFEMNFVSSRVFLVQNSLIMLFTFQQDKRRRCIVETL